MENGVKRPQVVHDLTKRRIRIFVDFDLERKSSRTGIWATPQSVTIAGAPEGRESPFATWSKEKRVGFEGLVQDGTKMGRCVVAATEILPRWSSGALERLTAYPRQKIEVADLELLRGVIHDRGTLGCGPKDPEPLPCGGAETRPIVGWRQLTGPAILRW